MSKGNFPEAHLATATPDEEEEFVVKREREGARNEVFLYLKISTKGGKKEIVLVILYFAIHLFFSRVFISIISKQNFLTFKRAAGFSYIGCRDGENKARSC